MSLPRTSPPLQSKKRKVNDLDSTEEDEASVNRKTKIIRFMDPEPTQIPNESPLRCRLLDHDHSIRMKAALPSLLPENNLAAVAAVNYNHPLHNIPVNQQQPTPHPQPRAHTQTPLHPQSRSQSQPQQPPPPPLRPQPQSQPQQPPRSIATPVVAAPSTPGSTSQSPHPTAVVNGSASTLGSSQRVATSPALHAMAVAGTNATSSSSPRPSTQSAIQPQQGQPQPQAQAQAVPQARPRYAAQVAQMQAAQAQQQQQQQQNVLAPHLSRTPMLSPAIVGATANSQATSGQGQHVAPQHFAASGQGQQSPQLSHQQQRQVMMAKAQYAAHLQQQQQQSHLGQTQDAAPTQQMSIPMNPMSPQMLQQLQLMQQHAAQAQAGGRVGGYPMHAWPQLQMSMNEMNGIAFRQGGGQPHANLTAAQAAQIKAAQQAQAQAQAQAMLMGVVWAQAQAQSMTPTQ
ncbi:hypothetical protein EDB83DRAFT_2673351 [Lactarius deliciosus]|nr:hypothetical protein EDB83DRAFT_2673351 [Lactarius deliciosus]